MRSAFFVATTLETKEINTIAIYDPSGFLSPQETKVLIEQSLDADKAVDIVTIDLDEQSGLADAMIIASGTSSRHVAAMAGRIKDRLADANIKGVRIEGQAQADWVVIDAGDIIVHLFRPEVREFYNMERMWGTGSHVEITEPHQVGA